MTDNISKKILGIDYGDKYIGLALANNNFVTPLETLENKPDHILETNAINKIIDIVENEQITEIIAGLPLLQNEKETESTQKVRRFINKLKNELIKSSLKIKPNVIYVNEHNTSTEATEEMIQTGISKGKRSANHNFAAVIILKRYLGIA